MNSQKKSSSNQETSPQNSSTPLINGKYDNRKIGFTDNDTYDTLLMMFIKVGVSKWTEKSGVSASLEGII